MLNSKKIGTLILACEVVKNHFTHENIELSTVYYETESLISLLWNEKLFIV